jgi:hypothetical protein
MPTVAEKQDCGERIVVTAYVDAYEHGTCGNVNIVRVATLPLYVWQRSPCTCGNVTFLERHAPGLFDVFLVEIVDVRILSLAEFFL